MEFINKIKERVNKVFYVENECAVCKKKFKTFKFTKKNSEKVNSLVKFCSEECENFYQIPDIFF